jgi:hypothetical protein
MVVAVAGGSEAATATRRVALGQGAGLALLSGALLGGVGASGRVGMAAAAVAEGAPEVTDKVRLDVGGGDR